MRLKLGELLVLEGVLTQAQLDRALKRQKTMGARIGTNLMELKYISEFELASVLGKQHGLPPVPPGSLDSPDPRLLARIPRQLAEKHLLVPFGFQGGKLLVAAMDPLDIQVIEALSFIAQAPIKVHLCPEARLYHSLHKFYGGPARFRYSVLLDPRTDSKPVRNATASRNAPAPSPKLITSEEDLAPFLSPTSPESVMSALQQQLARLCDRALLFKVDRGGVWLWDRADDFIEGRKGRELGKDLTEKSFIFRYLMSKTVFCGPLQKSPQNTAILGTLGNLYPPEIALLPFPMGNNSGYLLSGDNLISTRKIENLRKIKRIHMMGICALKIYLLRERIKSLEY
jgi:hypothetical protein